MLSAIQTLRHLKDLPIFHSLAGDLWCFVFLLNKIQRHYLFPQVNKCFLTLMKSFSDTSTKSSLTGCILKSILMSGSLDLSNFLINPSTRHNPSQLSTRTLMRTLYLPSLYHGNPTGKMHISSMQPFRLRTKQLSQ